MAKKAERRGRPPGAKNKKSAAKIGKLGNFAMMEVGELRAYIDGLQTVLAKKVKEQRAYFEGQLSQLGGYVLKKPATASKDVVLGNGKAAKRAKAKPKYQSKKDRSVRWSGRGVTPVWMREEMKGTKWTKDDFLIG
jgi:DNA-binding protein H-NS